MNNSFDIKSEINVREYFCMNINKYEYRIKISKNSFPDYILLNKFNKEIRAEAEYKSANFIQHGHSFDECELIICWIHNVKLPITILELSTEKKYKPDEKPKYLEFDALKLIKNKTFNKITIKQICKNCSCEYNAFMTAYAVYLKKSSEYLDNMTESALKLDKTRRNLVAAIVNNGGENIYEKLYNLHAKDLFNIVMHT